MRFAIFLAILPISIGLVLTRSDAITPIVAGFSEVDITAPVGFRMSGYFQERFSTGVKDPLYARSMVLKQGDTQVALVFCDLIGVPLAVTEQARQGASHATGIPKENILIAATHSHTGPLFFNARREYFHEQAIAEHGSDPHEAVDYESKLIADMVAGIQEAQSNLQPVNLQTGSTRVEGLSFNRRFHMKDGTVRFNPGRNNPDIVRPAGPIDPEMSLLFLETKESEQPIAAFTVFALHLDTTGGALFSADYPFYLHEKLREKYGEKFYSIFGPGTCGDINHINVHQESSQKKGLEAERIGNALAEEVLQAVTKLESLASPSLAVRQAVIQAPLQKYTEEEIEEAQENMKRIGTKDLPFLEQVRAYKILDLQAFKGETYPLEVQAIRLGKETAIVGLPAEIFVEIGLRIKEESPFQDTIVVELCNDSLGYIPTEKAFKEGSYETVNSCVQPGVGETLAATAIELLDQLDH
ncbi:MAG: neutral/alkaline non-lysosomal ceramidase N-terminal domain-containing protein [Candidatus Omnitrophica bacterium]|nr:neutral/alkaline non-lysosomal ceramidase N-terminal domain-containing protein [Candidatus Omnitrophota bacterium]